MSITFMPVNNGHYCEANGLIDVEVYTCQCVDFPEMFPNRCHQCNFTGQVEFKNCRFEMNASNGNAMDLMRMLNMPVDYSGECDPQDILDGIAFIRAMNAVGHAPLVKETTETRGEAGCRVIECGRDQDHVERYMVRMHEIAMEAARRKVNVCWG